MENPYTSALRRIIELEDKLEMADAKAGLAHGQNVDLGNQLRASFALLVKARDLLTITALESPLRRDIIDLVAEIDAFYPRRE